MDGVLADALAGRMAVDVVNKKTSNVNNNENNANNNKSMNQTSGYYVSPGALEPRLRLVRQQAY